MKTPYFVGAICVDCLYHSECGTAPGHMDAAELGEYERRVAEHLRGVESVALGHPCSEYSDCAHYPDLCPDDADCDCQHREFGTGRCDRCGSVLAGAREDVTFFLLPGYGLFRGGSVSCSREDADSVHPDRESADAAAVELRGRVSWPVVVRAVDYWGDGASCVHCGELVVPSGRDGQSWTHRATYRQTCAIAPGAPVTSATPEQEGK